MEDHMHDSNQKDEEEFVACYMPPGDTWRAWTSLKTREQFTIALKKAPSLSEAELEACFHSIESTSVEDYRTSKQGWKPKAKRKEMRLLDMKYLLVIHKNEIQGFCSFMPTYEDGRFVIYCYEIHLQSRLQGSGLGKMLMGLLEIIAWNIADAEKVMLTCFVRNRNALAFYRRLGYETDEYSPPPKILRNGTRVASDYVIMSKPIGR